MIYDIACQYFVHLHDRIGTHLLNDLKVDRAIGLFHVHAHQESCFFRYATSFIPGAGIVSGEILESLWSSLNAISPTVRTATLAHREEVLDDHASDSNHKNMLGIYKYLCQRYMEASDTVATILESFEQLSGEAGIQVVAAWMADIESAEAGRRHDITVMDIYATQGATPAEQDPAPAPAGPQKQVPSAIYTWLQFALMIEEKQ